ncbi:Ig-like domain-containing protein [Paenibacillus sp. OAE614]|uniref:Ig-like domain-containing protein n=1 Tax=Paenibacillus sp. OAE614 TaxID=2663804 RepID=UPI001789192B
MSNTSYPFKENSNVMNVQGGEKKVMKKILTVALSTAMAFSMFASVAFGDTAVTPQQKFDALAAKGIFNGYPDKQAHLEKEMTRAEFAKVITKLLGLKEVTGTLSYKDKGYDAKNWAVPYIEAVTAAGIMQGQDSVKKIFNYNGKVTIQEMATVLTRALKLEVPANPDNNAADWAKGYVQAAIDKGLISKDANFKANASRSQLVEAAYAIDQAANITFTYKVVDPSNVEFTLSTGEVVKVKLDKPLEANKETEVKFKDAAGNEYTAKVTYVVTTATKVASVTSSNLAQVVVSFDGEVDKSTAELVDNYTITERDTTTAKTVKSAVLSEDGKSVTLTVALPNATADSDKFVNQLPYKITFNNVKAGDKVLSATDYEFTPVDSTIPVPESVQALGNSTIRVVFNEPIEKANPSNFLVDGNTLVGNTKVSGNTVIVKLYTPLADGAHKITVTNVEDFAGFKSLSKELTYDVVKDETAPTVASVVNATFESVTLKFSEPVDPETVVASNVYWMQGTTKRTADVGSVVQIADDTYKFTFSGSNKIQYATDLFVTGVKDYSGNTIAADTKVQVNPVLDQNRPTVVNVSVNDARNVITVKFSKALLASSVEATDFVIKDADGKEVNKLKTVSLSGDRTVLVNLGAPLDESKKYTLEISGISDNTTLQNVLLPYSKEINVGDTTRPVVSDNAAKRNVANNTIVVSYPEKMAVSGDGSIVDRTHYFYTTSDDKNNWKVVPGSVNVNVTPDGKAAVLGFPTNIKVANVDKVRVQLVKDVAGNLMEGLSKDLNVGDPAAVNVTSVKATAANKIAVKFTENLLSTTVRASDFSVVLANGSQIAVSSAEVSDADTVVLTLAEDLKQNAKVGATDSDVYVQIKDGATTSTAVGQPISAVTTNTNANKVADAIKATVKSVSGPNNGTVAIQFNEALKASNDADYLKNIATDFVVKNSDGTLAPNTLSKGYTATVAGDVVTLTFTEPQSGILEVSIPNPRFLLDASDNVVASQTDAVQVKVSTVSAASLQAAITDAKTKFAAAQPGTADGQYPQAAIDAYEAAIKKAEDVVKNTSSTQAQIDAALSALNTATKDFESKKVTVSKSALSTEILTAQNLADSAVEGTDPGQYPKAAIDALNTAIANAKAVFNKANATQDEVNKAVDDLKTAETTFKAAVNK